MRIYNRSSLLVPSELWRDLADTLGLGGLLAGALSDDLGMYTGKQLRVFIDEVDQPKRRRSETGSYTYGEVRLFPCNECSAAFLTTVFLHELYHAYVHQSAPQLYDRAPHCRYAESFATRAFRTLGGQTSASCSGYVLSEATARRKVARVKAPRILAGQPLRAAAV